MVGCPHCLAPLPAGFARPAACPHCGQMVPGETAGSEKQTVADVVPPAGSIKATIDSIPSIDLQPPKPSPAAQENQAATLDSWAPIEATPKPKTFSDGTAKTIDSDTGFELRQDAAVPHETGFSISPPTPRDPRRTANDKFAQTIESDSFPED
ncbi:MAG: hypothetical protein KJZ78_28785, partial [Bryobacteraceae bacterium]|nr:hypothetical protein [Bryobacteraceae bacterium]